MENIVLFFQLAEFLFEPCPLFGEDVSSVPGLVLRKHWGRIRDENGKFPNFEVQMDYLMREETNI